MLMEAERFKLEQTKHHRFGLLGISEKLVYIFLFFILDNGKVTRIQGGKLRLAFDDSYQICDRCAHRGRSQWLRRRVILPLVFVTAFIATVGVLAVLSLVEAGDQS